MLGQTAEYWRSLKNVGHLSLLPEDWPSTSELSNGLRCRLTAPPSGTSAKWRARARASTTMRPRNAGIDPINRLPATIRPQTAIGPRVRSNRSDRRPHRGGKSDIPVQQQRKRNHADRQHQRGEEETNAHSRYDHLPARACREHIADERGDRDRRLGAESELVNQIGRKQPEQKNREQNQSQHKDRTEPGRADHAERIHPRDASALLTPSAHFVKPHRRDRADKCEAGCERKQERQHFVAESQPRQRDADERVDEAKEDNVRSIRREIVEAFNQRVPEVGGLDPLTRASRRTGSPRSRAGSDPAIPRSEPQARVDPIPTRWGFGYGLGWPSSHLPNFQFEGRGPPVARGRFGR